MRQLIIFSLGNWGITGARLSVVSTCVTSCLFIGFVDAYALRVRNALQRVQPFHR